MKLFVFAAAAALTLSLAPMHQAQAQTHGPRIEIGGDSPARLAERHDPRRARIAITTTDQVASFVLTPRVVALQLTDRGLRDVRREIDRDIADEKGFVARLIANTVRNTVTSFLDRSIEYPVSELRDVQYRDGRLVFVTEDGERIFQDVEINDTDVAAGFRPADARAFVREFRAVKAQAR